jgi:hypothetical protein
VPSAGLPPWMQVIATINPLSYAIDAARGWALADPAFGATTVSALLTSAVLTVGAATIAVRSIPTPSRMSSSMSSAPSEIAPFRVAHLPGGGCR